MYYTGWIKSRRALDCFFTFMAKILQGLWQILDRSGKKIILLSPLLKTATCEAILSVKEWNLKLKIKLRKRTVQHRRYGRALVALASQT